MAYFSIVRTRVIWGLYVVKDKKCGLVKASDTLAKLGKPTVESRLVRERDENMYEKSTVESRLIRERDENTYEKSTVESRLVREREMKTHTKSQL